MDLAVQKSAGRQHHGAAAESNARLGAGAHHAVALHHQVVHCLLKQPQVRLVFKHATNRSFVQNAVRLRTGRTHSGAFGAVQNTELNAPLIGRQSHGATQSIHLFDQMAFADAANRRVAAHLTQGFNVVT